MKNGMFTFPIIGVFLGEYLSAYIWVDVEDQLKYPENNI